MNRTAKDDVREVIRGQQGCCKKSWDSGFGDSVQVLDFHPFAVFTVSLPLYVIMSLSSLSVGGAQFSALGSTPAPR
jgi:hypothetical protein